MAALPLAALSMAALLTAALLIGLRIMRFYLASTSPARLALLRQIAIEPVVIPSFVDEEAAVLAAEADGPLTAPELVQLLARLKAEAVLHALPNGEPIDGFILGGDSAFEIDGTVFGKPHLPEVARERWQRQRGRTGVLHSGHWLIDHRIGSTGPGVASRPLDSAGITSGSHATEFTSVGAVDSAEVEFAADISDAEIDAYIATGEPLEVAGAFTVDGRGAPFIRRITGAPSAVIGMSLPVVRTMLAGFGVALTDFQR